MNCNEKIYYIYVENGKAVITKEKPDFDKVHDYMIMKADGIELFMGVHKNQDDLMLPDEPIDVASMLKNHRPLQNTTQISFKRLQNIF